MVDHLVIDIKVTLFIPLNPAILFLHMALHMYKYDCMPKTFMVVLLTIAKDWKQSQ